MDLPSSSRQPSNTNKSPRLQTQLSAGPISDTSDPKKPVVLSPGKEASSNKAFQYLIKSSATPVKESANIGNAASPKLTKNLTDKSPLQDSSKKANRALQLNKSKDAGLPSLGNEEKSRILGYYEESTKDLENIDRLADSTVKNNEGSISLDAGDNQKFLQGHKLPIINNKKGHTKTDPKNKRANGEKHSSVLGLGKGDLDLHVSPKHTNQRLTVQLSNSPITKTPKADEVFMVGTRKIYAEDKNRPNFSMEPVIRTKYGSVGPKTLYTNMSGGEEEETSAGKGISPLMISPLRGAQRAMKPIMKKIEIVRNRRVGSPDSKNRSVDVIDLRRPVKKKSEAPKVEKVELKKVNSKKKEEEKIPAGNSHRESNGKSAAGQAVKEEKEAKKKVLPVEEEMDGWGKHESEDSVSRDADDDEPEEEKKENVTESSPRREEKQADEKPNKEQGKEEKTRDKVISNSAKKNLPGSPRLNREKSDAVRQGKKIQDSVQSVVLAGKDPVQAKREQAYLEFMQKVNFSFNVQVKVPTEKTFTAYKYFLGKGNNSIMLKAMMKQRWWWTHVDNKDAADINFMWTQLKQNTFINGLKQRRKNPFDNLEWSGVSSHNVNDTTAGTTTTIDSITDCESDTTEGETRVVIRKSRKSTTSKATGKGSKKKTTVVVDKSMEDLTAAQMKKLFTTHETMLMNSASSNKGTLYPEDYEEIGKMRRGPGPQVISDPSIMKMCNHLESNFHLANKKALLWNMKSYYEAIKQNVFDYLPLTFHVRNGFDDKEYHKFIEYYSAREKEIQEQEKAISEAKEGKKPKKLRNIWIVKPGENTNRGVGIHVCDSLSQINELVATTEGNVDGKKRTYLIQQYLDKPLLYNKRKFDIRCYILMTCINGMMKGYWYQDGYIRTASKEFSLKNVTNKFVHLTNDAVQKKAEDYGKFESGNKLSYNDFQKYLDAHHEGNISFANDIYPQLKQLATDAIKGMYGKIDPYRRENCFEVFGLDFMIDTSLRAWLIEVNTNPDINASSPVLTRVIPNMVENALRLTIDQMYPPPAWQMSKKQMLPENLLENNKFELVFDEVEDGPALRAILQPEKGATGDLILEIVAEEEDEEEEIKE